MLPGFKDTVTRAWNMQSSQVEPFHRLYHKLHDTAVALREWSSRLIPYAKMQLYMALEVILRLDSARTPSTHGGRAPPAQPAENKGHGAGCH